MDYSSFCEAFEASIIPKLKPASSIRHQKLHKNNGVPADALSIHTPGQNSTPVLYLSQLYNSFLQGSSMEEITASAMESLEHSQILTEKFTAILDDFSVAREHIVCRLISRSANKSLLADVPWLPFLDMAVVFAIHMKQDQGGQAVSILRHHQMNQWNLTPEKLYSLALSNTKRLFPPVLNRLSDLFFDRSREGMALLDELPEPVSSSPSEDFPSIYVLTNSAASYGACCFLYDDLISSIAEKLGTDLLILPSSIHELLLMPDLHTMKYEAIEKIIRSVNTHDVEKSDVLSDHLYLYSSEKRQIMIWNPDETDCKLSDEKKNLQ